MQAYFGNNVLLKLVIDLHNALINKISFNNIENKTFI